MPSPPQPRFTDLETFRYYLSASGSTVPKAAVQEQILAGAEFAVERYCRRRFAPEPAPRTDYKRSVVSLVGQGQTNLLQLAGSFTLSYAGQATPPLVLPVTAAQLQAALTALPTVGAGKISCDGGPLPSYPVNCYLTGLTADPSPIIADSTGLQPSGFAVVTDAGFDSNPPVQKRYTTRGRTEVRVQDLRLVDAGADPSVPGSGGIQLYGRRLLPNQYFMEYAGYAPGSADEAIGSGDYAEPASHLILGYGYGMGMTLAQQFAFVLPQMYLANDLWITGRWGWLPTPPDVVDATYALATRRYREKDAAFGDTTITAEGAVLQFTRNMPASVRGVLDGYRVPHVSVL